MRLPIMKPIKMADREISFVKYPNPPFLFYERVKEIRTARQPVLLILVIDFPLIPFPSLCFV